MQILNEIKILSSMPFHKNVISVKEYYIFEEKTPRGRIDISGYNYHELGRLVPSENNWVEEEKSASNEGLQNKKKFR